MIDKSPYAQAMDAKIANLDNTMRDVYGIEPCERCGSVTHLGLRGSEAWKRMVSAGCTCEWCTHEPCGRSDCAFNKP